MDPEGEKEGNLQENRPDFLRGLTVAQRARDRTFPLGEACLLHHVKGKRGSLLLNVREKPVCATPSREGHPIPS